MISAVIAYGNIIIIIVIIIIIIIIIIAHLCAEYLQLCTLKQIVFLGHIVLQPFHSYSYGICNVPPNIYYYYY